MAAGLHLELEWVEAQHLEKETQEKEPDKYEASWQLLRSVDGILVPGGFGNRGVEGKIRAAEYARTHRVPYLGICLGMQVRRRGRWGFGWSDGGDSHGRAVGI